LKKHHKKNASDFILENRKGDEKKKNKKQPVIHKTDNGNL